MDSKELTTKINMISRSLAVASSYEQGQAFVQLVKYLGELEATLRLVMESNPTLYVNLNKQNKSIDTRFVSSRNG
jgi:hypothetical protein